MRHKVQIKARNCRYAYIRDIKTKPNGRHGSGLVCLRLSVVSHSISRCIIIPHTPYHAMSQGTTYILRYRIYPYFETVIEISRLLLLLLLAVRSYFHCMLISIVFALTLACRFFNRSKKQDHFVKHQGCVVTRHVRTWYLPIYLYWLCCTYTHRVPSIFLQQ